MVVTVQNPDSGESVEIQGRIQEKVVRFLHANPGIRFGTTELAQRTGEKKASVFHACSSVKDRGIITGILGKSRKVYMEHPTFGPVTQPALEAERQRLKASGLSDQDVEAGLARIRREAEFRGRPDERKWRWNPPWIIA